MYTTLILSVHVVVAFTIIGLVLIQHGKGADAGAAFGGGGGGAGGASGSVFGAQGSSNFLSRTTGILAAIFFCTSLAMAYLTTSGHEVPVSLMEENAAPVSDMPSVVPVVPAADIPADVPGMSAPESPNAEIPASSGSTTSSPSDVPTAPK